eukprot:scaffold254374_cov28-Tisochrysis_lutea.AAC.2
MPTSPKQSRPSSPITRGSSSHPFSRHSPLAPTAHDVASLHLRRAVRSSKQRFDSADHAMKLEAEKVERARARLLQLRGEAEVNRPRRSSLAAASRTVADKC